LQFIEAFHAGLRQKKQKLFIKKIVLYNLMGLIMKKVEI